MIVGHWLVYRPGAVPPDGSYIVWCRATEFYEAGFEEASVVAGRWVFAVPRFEADFFGEAEDPNVVVTHYAKPLAPQYRRKRKEH